MSAYMVISVNPNDEEKFRDYEARTLDVVRRFGGEPIARETSPLTWESVGKPDLGVILRFEDKAAVQAFYESEDYAPLKEFRRSFADATAVVIDGV